MEQFVIVGGGRAGAFAAETLRDEGFTGGIRIISDEHHLPYDHPPLSKDYLQGGPLADVWLHAGDWYSEHDIRRHVATATELDTDAHTVSTDDGQQVSYDRLLLATGARSKPLDVDGDERAVFLRTLDEGKALREKLEGGGKHVVVIGSGWIGMEVAASATALGNRVTVLGHGAEPLASAIGDELGAYVRAVHERNGVDIRMSTRVKRLTAKDVEVHGSDAVKADLVLAATGAVPNTELAEAAGLDVKHGILTDATLATSSADVFAAGDVANALHPFTENYERSEHWSHASDQGAVAARSMMGTKAVFDRIPYFFTDQFDFSMEFSGFSHLARDAQVVYRGFRGSGQFVAFWLDEESRVVAGMNVNVWDVADTIQELVASRRTVSPEHLMDESLPLSKLTT